MKSAADEKRKKRSWKRSSRYFFRFFLIIYKQLVYIWLKCVDISRGKMVYWYVYFEFLVYHSMHTELADYFTNVELVECNKHTESIFSIPTHILYFFYFSSTHPFTSLFKTFSKLLLSFYSRTWQRTWEIKSFDKASVESSPSSP